MQSIADRDSGCGRVYIDSLRGGLSLSYRGLPPWAPACPPLSCILAASKISAAPALKAPDRVASSSCALFPSIKITFVIPLACASSDSPCSSPPSSSLTSCWSSSSLSGISTGLVNDDSNGVRLATTATDVAIGIERATSDGSVSTVRTGEVSNTAIVPWEVVTKDPSETEGRLEVSGMNPFAEPSSSAIVRRAGLDATDVKVSVVPNLNDPLASVKSIPPDPKMAGANLVLLDLSGRGAVRKESAVPSKPFRPLMIVGVSELETVVSMIPINDPKPSSSSPLPGLASISPGVNLIARTLSSVEGFGALGPA